MNEKIMDFCIMSALVMVNIIVFMFIIALMQQLFSTDSRPAVCVERVQ